MSKDLKRPSAPHRIDELPFHEPMRMTWNGNPIVGMKVGDTAFPTLLIITNKGVVCSLRNPPNYGRAFSFIDYLLENESFTVFGSAVERADDTDLGPEEKVEFRPEIKVGSSDYRNLPNFSVFYTQNKHGSRPKLCMIVHGHPSGAGYAKSDAIGIGAILTMDEKHTNEQWRNGWDVEIYGRDDQYFENSYRFVRWADDSNKELFRKHHSMLGSEYRDRIRKLPGLPKGW